MLLAGTGIFAIVLLFTGCADERIQSSWMRASPSIDGNLEEWMEIPRLILSDAEASVRAGNDSSFLYIAGHIANAPLRAKVRQFGIIVWLDPEGGHRKDLEVHIPASRVAGGNLARGGFWENLTTEEKARVLARMRELSRGVLVVDRRICGGVCRFSGTAGLRGADTLTNRYDIPEVQETGAVEKSVNRHRTRSVWPGRTSDCGP
jgi:hypothetical protein